MIDWWGPVINEFYGSTESSAVTLASSADTIAKPGTVGRAVQGAELRILDEAGQILPVGEVGEIFTRFAELPDFTYHNRPDERARIDREGFITSGDVGYLDADGYLFLCDRKRDMVISGGVNIYPAEIEAVLHALAGVKDCAVFGIPDAEFGERLMAVVEPADGAALTAADVQAHLRAHLADYKVPRSIEIARDLPREDSRQDLQAPPARPLLAGCRSADLARRSEPMIEVHHLNNSRSQRILWLLEELGLAYRSSPTAAIPGPASRRRS